MFVQRKEYNNVITVKLVIPVSCNAKCAFCYNKDKVITFDKTTFKKNFLYSLDDILTKIGDKNPVSLDITGGEPTLDVELLKYIFNQLKAFDIQSKVLRVTMTTNGTNLLEVIPYMEDVVNYVNISVHDFRFEERKKIFGFGISDDKYKMMIDRLNQIGIPVSVCSVIFDKRYSEQWREAFVDWAHQLGFLALRFRCNVFWNDKQWFDQQLLSAKTDSRYKVITYENTSDSHWLRLRRNSNGFRVFFLHGVLDTSIKTKGIEYVIDDDGMCYCDFYKRTPIDQYQYEVGMIYDDII